MLRLEEPGAFMETSDVYSFGVFLFELVTGHEASHIASLGSYEAIIEWVSKIWFLYFSETLVQGFYFLKLLRFATLKGAPVLSPSLF